MVTRKIEINNIPALLWGKDKRMAVIAVHGNMSSKEDEVIRIFAEEAEKHDYQVLSFDLPEHGERKNDHTYLCNPQNCIKDLKIIMEYVKLHFDYVYLWACSMGAYFSMLAYKDEEIEDAFFLSPIVNMKIVIDNMMKMANVSEEELKEKRIIKTDFGPVLYWDYYEFVKNNPIEEWIPFTSILYGKRDNMQDENTIDEFVKRNNVNLITYEEGEHYFHTEEQLKFYKESIFNFFIY